MTMYVFGSVEGLAALQQAVAAHVGPHEQYCTPEVAREMASALETADFAGKPWAELYTGFPVERSECWWGYLCRMTLTLVQVRDLVETMALAWELGDPFAGEWLGDMADSYGVEWV